MLIDYLRMFDTLPSLEFDDNDYYFIIDETLDALDITSEAEATSVSLKTVARWKYWERVVAKTTDLNDWSAKDRSSSDNQFNVNAKDMLHKAELDARQYVVNDDTLVISYTDNPREVDPYVYSADRELL